MSSIPTTRERYQKLSTTRSQYLNTARAAAALTLPHLIPDVDDPSPNYQHQIQLPFTGLGQLGVTTFAAKLAMALMPPGENSFRYQISEVERLKLQQQMEQSGAPEEEIAAAMADVDAGLLAREQSTLREIEAYNDRVRVFELLLHLIVAGNALCYVGPKNMRVYHINQYVLRRDAKGPSREAIIKETVYLVDLPEKVKTALVKEKPELFAEEVPPDQTIDLYTHVRWGEKRVTWHQEIHDVVVLEGEPSPIDAPAWIATRMFHVSGQDWSPGYVEACCLADLQTANLLSQAITEGALMSALLKFMRKPNGAARAEDFAKARNGDVFDGNPDDIAAIQIGKAGDFRVAAEELNRIEQRLRSAFMMLQIRNSERTTREEVQATVMELQQSQGNVYSILTNEFQTPYIMRRLSLLGGENKMSASTANLIKPVVNVGLAAVGRSVELEKYRNFLGVARENFGEEAVVQYVDMPFVLRRMASSLNLLTPGLVKSDERIAQEEQQARMDQMRNAAMQAGAADPQKLANAAATANEMGMLSPPEEGMSEQPEEQLQ